MWDISVPNFGLYMELDTLEGLTRFELPGEYGWRTYQPGDDRVWAEIWHSAGAFATVREALDCFHGDFPSEEPLFERMLFLTDGGIPFATATAWFNENDGRGRLHWVGIDEAHQGRGLSRPLVSLALDRLRELGHTSACLGTCTPCWVAIGVYNKSFGFRPSLGEGGNAEGWKVVSERSGIDYEAML